MNQARVLKFANIGRDVVIQPFAKLVSPDHISIGDSVNIDDFVLLVAGRSTKIGSFVHIAAFVSIAGGGEFVIDDFAGVSAGTRLYTGNDDYLGGSLTGPTVPFPYRIPVRSSLTIRKHVVIGANSVVLPGVVIGEGAVIGAGSFVKEDCEPWTVYVGSPVRPIRARPRERILELEAQLRSRFYDANGRYVGDVEHRVLEDGQGL